MTLSHLAAEVRAGLAPPRRREAVDPALIVALVQALTLVLQACYPPPAEAAAWVRSGGGGFWWGRRRWEATVRRAVRRTWAGDRGAVPAVEAAVLARLRRGVDAATVGRLYAESNGTP